MKAVPGNMLESGMRLLQRRVPLPEGGMRLLQRRVPLPEGGVRLLQRRVPLIEGGMRLLQRRVPLAEGGVRLLQRRMPLPEGGVLPPEGLRVLLQRSEPCQEVIQDVARRRLFLQDRPDEPIPRPTDAPASRLGHASLS
jgi:hypothetical protein